jgi:hypothetical protein
MTSLLVGDFIVKEVALQLKSTPKEKPHQHPTLALFKCLFNSSFIHTNRKRVLQVEKLFFLF